MKNRKLLAYAIDFTSFLIERTDVGKIQKVVLFGSVARDEAGIESDVDIFVDSIKPEEIKKEVIKVTEEFYRSKRYTGYWQLKGVENEVKPIIGKLDEWKDLKSSVLSDGIMLYGKLEEAPRKAASKTLLSWENIKPESRRVLLSKRMFGYKKGDKRYEGLMQKYGGEKSGKGQVIIPSISANVFITLFRKMGIPVKIRKMMEF